MKYNFSPANHIKRNNNGGQRNILQHPNYCFKCLIIVDYDKYTDIPGGVQEIHHSKNQCTRISFRSLPWPYEL